MALKYFATQSAASTPQNVLHRDQMNAESQPTPESISSEPHPHVDFVPPGQRSSHSRQPFTDARYAGISNPSWSMDVAEHPESFRRTGNHSHPYAVFDQHPQSPGYRGFGNASLSPLTPLEQHTRAPASAPYPSGPSAVRSPQAASLFHEYSNALTAYHLQRQWQASQSGPGLLQNSGNDSSVISFSGLPGKSAASYSANANHSVPSSDFQALDLEYSASYDQVYVASTDLVSNGSGHLKDLKSAAQPASLDRHQTVPAPPIIPMSNVDSHFVPHTFVSDYSVDISSSLDESPSNHSASHLDQAQQIDPHHVKPGGSYSQVSQLLSTSPLQSLTQPYSDLRSPTSRDVSRLSQFNTMHDKVRVTEEAILTLDAVDISPSMEGNSAPPVSLYSITLEEQAEDEPYDNHHAASPAKKRPKMHECPVCHKKFPRPSGLKTHINTHSNAKPHACEFPGCTRSFNVRSNARRHLRTHGVESLPVRSTAKDAYVIDFSEPVIMPPPPHSTSGSLDGRQQAGVGIPVQEGLSHGLAGTGGRKPRESSFKVRWDHPKRMQLDVEVLNQETRATRGALDIAPSGSHGIGTLSQLF